MRRATGYPEIVSRRSRLRGAGGRRTAAERPPPVRPLEVPGPRWDGTSCVKPAQIAAYCRLLASEFRPQRIILFGSYAYGSPTKESDVDLMVVMPHRSGPERQSVAIRRRCSAPFPLDLLVWTPSYVQKRQTWNDSFTREVFGRGKILYEASHP
jgi:uncharacterized protein